MRHVFAFKYVVAQHTALCMSGCGDRARKVSATARRPRDQRRADKGSDERNERRERLRHRAERTYVSAHRKQRGQQRGADTDRVDVVQMGALKFDSGGAPTQRLVDHQIGNQRAHPRNRQIRVKAEHALQCLEHAEHHHQHRQQHIEDHPHHPARMIVREPGEKI